MKSSSSPTCRGSHRLLKRVLYVLIAGVAALLLLLLTPELWFRPFLVSRVIERLAHRQSLDIRWKEIRAHARHHGLKTLGFRLALDEVRLAPRSATSSSLSFQVEADIPKLVVEVRVDWLHWPPRLRSIEELTLKASRARYTTVATPQGLQTSADRPSSSKPEHSWSLPNIQLSMLIPSWLSELEVGQVAVELPEFEVAESSSTQGSASSPSSSPTSAEPVRLAGWVTSAGAPESRLFATIASAPPNSPGSSPAKFAAQLSVGLGPTSRRTLLLNKTHVEAQATLSQGETVIARLDSIDGGSDPNCEKDRTCLSGSLSIESPRSNDWSTRIKFTSSLQENEAQIRVEGALVRVHPWLPELATQQPCVVHLSSQTVSSTEAQASTRFRCEMRANLKVPPLPPKARVPLLQLPSQSHFSISLDAQLKQRGDVHNYQGNIEFSSHPLLAPLISATLDVKSAFHGVLEEKLDGFHHHTRLATQVRVPQVEKAITRLHDTAWAVPAPLNNLKGALALDLDSEWKDWSTQIPFKFTSQLESTEQALRTTGQGELALRANPRDRSPPQPPLTHPGTAPIQAKLQAQLTLAQVRISAPRLDLREIPRFFPDRRIRSRAAEQALASKSSVRPSSLEFEYEVKVQTPPEQPLLIDTNLADAPVALDIQGQLSNTRNNQLTIKTRPVRFEVFRREATFERMEVQIQGPDEPVRLDGMVNLQSGEYTIYAHVFGSPEKVKVHLTSEPPVEERELWAILLFGESIEDLEAEDQDSAKSTQRLLSRGGLSLLSLYAFAGTPIERVEYDPNTQKAAIRFRVAQGTSLKVGHDVQENENSVGVRKRLGNGWAINAEVNSAQSSSSGAGSGSGGATQEAGETKKRNTEAGASLEWSKRY